MPTALITGVGGQDGSYLAEMLLREGYNVVGTVRGPTTASQPRIEHLRGLIDLTEADLLDQTSLEDMLKKYRPTEIYNFAAYHPASSQSFTNPTLVGELNGLAVLRLLEAVKAIDPSIRFYQASTAQIFGRPYEKPQNENTRFNPINPYGIAKLYGQLITTNYREAYGLFACSGILFNHESPRRDEKFVTRKITLAVARIKAGLQDRLILEDLDARRDWGYAPDYVGAMRLMLRASAPGDYVLATGHAHSVRRFCQVAFDCVGLDYAQYVAQETRSGISTGGVELVGDAGKARKVLDWRPTLKFEELVKMMVYSDIELLGKCSRLTRPFNVSPS